MPDPDAASLNDTVADTPAISDPAPDASPNATFAGPAEGSTATATGAGKAGLRSKLANLFNWSRQPGPGGDDASTRAAVEVAVARRDASLLQLKEGYTDAVDTMAAVRRHMDEQARRSDRVIELLEGLPDILRAMPESAEKQARILEHIQGSLESQHNTTKSLATALQSATESQKQVSTHLKAQLDASNHSREAMRDTLGTLTATMSDVTQSNAATRDAIAQQANDAREMVGRNQRFMVIAIVALAVIAVGVLAGFAYIVSTFQASTSAAVTTPPAIVAVEGDAPVEPMATGAEPAVIEPAPAEAAAESVDTADEAPAPLDDADPMSTSDLPPAGF
ncbi:MAG: hypothetical protein AAF078_08800 [Planctomycetota bacterium]